MALCGARSGSCAAASEAPEGNYSGTEARAATKSSDMRSRDDFGLNVRMHAAREECGHAWSGRASSARVVAGTDQTVAL